MNKTVVMLLAWWFLSWGMYENHYGMINRVGPFDAQEDCEFYRNKTGFPLNPPFHDRRKNHTSPSCWYTREQVIEVPKEAPRAR